MTQPETIDIIIPCYNESEVIKKFYHSLSGVLSGQLNMEYRLLMVDDGSSDSTLEIIQSLAADDQNVKYLSFSRNFGKEAAIYAGLLYSHADYAVIMDADLQDPPEMIPEMLRAVKEEGYECCCTSRATRTGEPSIRSFFASVFYKVFNHISMTKLVKGARDFRLMSRKYVNAVKSICERNRFSKGIYIEIKHRPVFILKETNVNTAEKKEG